eukprot:TRINITY_DN22891_c0_g1_i1.p1 TRINITY_DN22891_c0_g1~~TRINITY_DN22891_c0_g1_i1.p1  ORF type:complete len:414 (+),score=75.65 TRINITY_DN22891_c0_g1_i1:112-1353(+)
MSSEGAYRELEATSRAGLEVEQADATAGPTSDAMATSPNEANASSCSPWAILVPMFALGIAAGMLSAQLDVGRWLQAGEQKKFRSNTSAPELTEEAGHSKQHAEQHSEQHSELTDRHAQQHSEQWPVADGAPIMNFYMYRVQNDEDYSPENQNMANAAGALWYLHNEIVWHHWNRGGTYASTPKTRIERFLVFTRATPQLYKFGMNFGVVNTYDLGKCSGPFQCENLQEYGPVVGCESWNSSQGNNFPHGQWVGKNVYPGALWYSLPGACSSQKFWNQTGDCLKDEPGGACPPGQVPLGSMTCTYTYDKVGEIRISDLENISSFKGLISDGGREYSKTADAGTHLHFWDNIHDVKACQHRIDSVIRRFHEKYPRQPDLEDPVCDFSIDKFYPNFPKGTFERNRSERVAHHHQS